ncbi:MAG TPA: thioesterase family protein [Candidatus Angelobacter sp.]|jgi:4-hydroxybenzoyl-CoA thioesterase|nr:thioesterase family protein [Candidatus Angelobacter sp.]
MAEAPAISPKEEVPEPSFRTEVAVRFEDCDPAGIVFYPRFLVMFNNLVEDWWREGLKFSFNELVLKSRWGIPTVHLEVDFYRPSTLGDVLSANLYVHSLGRSSVKARIVLAGPDGEVRVKGNVVLVLMDLGEGRAIPFPDWLRERIQAFVKE